MDLRTLNVIVVRITTYYVSQGNSRQDAAELASEELHWLRRRAHAHQSSTVETDPEQRQRHLQHMVDQLVREHKPLAYILGDQPFHPLRTPLELRPPLLIPRPETEYWVNQLSTLLPPSASSQESPYRILDIGTGTGCIPLALVHSLLHWQPTSISASASAPIPDLHIQALGIDQSPLSIECATHNAQINDLSSHCHFTLLDLFDPDLIEKLAPPFHLVVSNPPYIPRQEWAELAPNVKQWEDEKALVAGEDGLLFYSRIVELLPRLLRREGGMVALEVGKGQVPTVRKMVEGLGMTVQVMVDQWGVERCVVGSSIRTSPHR
ncbi:BQ2448_1325 [Microbotryum intermedium]|uniref:BQ2448_1325 protein n=1 Tax=Microbotryum intermedium TaxID=269621 RepID=A0A238FCT5_9BASI|nr:BQ2448_1325 [Microbotryum intermedium]